MNNKQNLDKLKHHCVFDSDAHVYVLLAVARKKYNPTLTNSKEVVFRECIRHELDIERKYNKIKSLIENYRGSDNEVFNFHLYVSVNPRHSYKAWFLLQEQINGWIKEALLSEVDNSNKFRRVDAHWYSALMKPACKAGKKFLIDIDTPREDVLNAVRFVSERMGLEAHNYSETTQGYHFVVDAFDRRKFEVLLMKYLVGEDNGSMASLVEIKTDALFFIDYIGEDVDAMLESV